MHTLGLQGNPSSCCPGALASFWGPTQWRLPLPLPKGLCVSLRVCVSARICMCLYVCVSMSLSSVCLCLLAHGSEATAHALLHLAYCWGHREVSVLENEPHRISDSEPLPPAPARPHGWNIGAHNSDPQPDSPTCLSLAALGPGEGSRGHREEL